jgi:decaprenylphospho-beta-D-erythro-pentofuranosid-2-ulose 2-reductase
LQNILIIGANSAIAKSCARLYAKKGCHLYLVGRNIQQLDLQKEDLRVRGASQIETTLLNVDDISAHEKIIADAKASLGSIDLVLICHGVLPDQERCEQDFTYAMEQFHTNTISSLSLLHILARTMAAQGSGTIAVITSVAGDRGRQSNYHYGASKGTLSLFLEGLRGSLLKNNVLVVDIKPGFVASPMTEHISKGALWSSPDKIAICMTRGIAKGRTTIYAPGYWRLIMLVVKLIPEFIFKRLKF